MASLNKASLREEFETLKGQFERLCTEGKMAEESRTLFQAMLMLFEVLMAVFMEKNTRKNNRNSSLPSSQTGKDDDTAPQSGTNAKGKRDNHTRSGNTRTVQTVALAPVDRCHSCGEDLSDIPCQGHERRTRIDIVFEKVLSHVDAEIKQCPRCPLTTHKHISRGRYAANRWITRSPPCRKRHRRHSLGQRERHNGCLAHARQ
jgi:hypothetical protein